MNTIDNAILTTGYTIRKLQQELELARKNAKGCYRFYTKHKDSSFLKAWSLAMHKCKMLCKKLKAFSKRLETVKAFVVKSTNNINK